MAYFRNRRFNSRRRNFRRRRTNFNRRNNNIFKRKVQRVSNRPYIKPRNAGFGNVATNITRRLIAYPSSGVKPSPEKPAPDSSWWLDGLSWLSSVALQLLGVFVSLVDEDDKKIKFYLTGAGTRIEVDSGFILQSCSLAINQRTNIHIPFEQYRLLWIRFVITPIVDVSKRGGSYACAIVPLDYNGSVNDVDIDFDNVMRQPGSVIRPIDKPCSVSWSPSVLEYGLRWHDIKDKQDPPMCVFVISFSDLALKDPDEGGTSSAEYNPSKAGFEIIVESRVEVRRYGLTERNVTLRYSDPSVISLRGLDRKCEVLFSSVKWNKGLGVIENEDDIINVVRDSRSSEGSCSGEFSMLE